MSESPLQGRRILVTRPRHQQQELVALLDAAGADVVAVPMVRIEALLTAAELAHSAPAPEPGRARIAVFTSANAARFVIDATTPDSPLAAYLEGSTVVAIGPATAAVLRAAELPAEVIADEYVAEAVAGALLQRGLRHTQVFLPRAEGARDVLPARLREAGAEVHVLAVYRAVLPETAPAELAAALAAGPPAAVTFTSSSTVRHFAEALQGRPFPEGAAAACIGPVTAATAAEQGFPGGPVAAVYTARGLVDALSGWFALG